MSKNRSDLALGFLMYGVACFVAGLIAASLIALVLP